MHAISRLRLFKIVAYFLRPSHWEGSLVGCSSRAHLLFRWAPVPIPPSQRVMENLDARLKLTSDEKVKLQPILDEWGRQAEQIPRRPRRRRDLFEQYPPRVREALTSTQQVEFDRLVAEIREKFERRLR